MIPRLQPNNNLSVGNGQNALQLLKHVTQLTTRFAIAKKLQKIITDPFRTGLRGRMTKHELIIQRLVIILNTVNEKIGLQTKEFTVTAPIQQLIVYGLYESHRICEQLFVGNLKKGEGFKLKQTNYFDSQQLKILLKLIGIQENILDINVVKGYTNLNLNQFLTQVDSQMVGQVLQIVELALKTIIFQSKSKQYEMFTQYISKFYLYQLLAEKIMQINYAESALTIEYIFLDPVRNAIRYLLREILGILIAFIIVSTSHFYRYGQKIQDYVVQSSKNDPKNPTMTRVDIQMQYKKLAENQGLLKFRRRLAWINMMWKSTADSKLQLKNTIWSQDQEHKYRQPSKKDSQDIFAQNYLDNKDKLNYLQKIVRVSVAKSNGHQQQTSIVSELTNTQRDGLMKKYQRMTIIASKLYLDYLKSLESSIYKSKQKQGIYNQKYSQARIFLMTMFNIANSGQSNTNSNEKILMYLDRAKSLAYQMKPTIAQIDIKAIQLNDRLTGGQIKDYFLNIFRINSKQFTKLSEVSLQNLIHQVQSSTQEGLLYSRIGWNIVIPRYFQQNPIIGPEYAWTYDQFDTTYLNTMKKKFQQIKDLQTRFPRIYEYVMTNIKSQFDNKYISRSPIPKLLITNYFQYFIDSANSSALNSPYYKEQLQQIRKQIDLNLFYTYNKASTNKSNHPKKITEDQRNTYMNNKLYGYSYYPLNTPKSKFQDQQLAVNNWASFLERHYTNIDNRQQVNQYIKLNNQRLEMIQNLQKQLQQQRQVVSTHYRDAQEKKIQIDSLKTKIQEDLNQAKELQKYIQSLEDKNIQKGQLKIKAQQIFQQFPQQFIWQSLGKDKSRQLFTIFLLKQGSIEKGVQSFIRFSKEDGDNRERLLQQVLVALKNQQQMKRQIQMKNMLKKTQTSQIFDAVYDTMKETGVFKTLQSLSLKKQILSNTIDLYKASMATQDYSEKLSYSSSIRAFTKNIQQINKNQQKLWEQIIPFKKYLKKNFVQSIIDSQPERNKSELAKRLLGQVTDLEKVTPIQPNLLANLTKALQSWKRKALIDSQLDTSLNFFAQYQSLINQIKSQMRTTHGRDVSDIQIMKQVLEKYRQSVQIQKNKQSEMTIQKAQFRCLISNASKNMQILARSYAQIEELFNEIGRQTFKHLDQESVNMCLQILSLLKQNQQIINQVGFTQAIGNCFVLKGYTDHKKILDYIQKNKLISKYDLTKLLQRVSYLKSMKFKTIGVSDYQ